MHGGPYTADPESQLAALTFLPAVDGASCHGAMPAGAARHGWLDLREPRSFTPTPRCWQLTRQGPTLGVIQMTQCDRCRYDVTHTLDQVFRAPTLIKHVLAAEANINETYICKK